MNQSIHGAHKFTDHDYVTLTPSKLESYSTPQIGSRQATNLYLQTTKPRVQASSLQ
jgi:hypothetical protein